MHHDHAYTEEDEKKIDQEIEELERKIKAVSLIPDLMWKPGLTCQQHRWCASGSTEGRGGGDTPSASLPQCV